MEKRKSFLARAAMMLLLAMFTTMTAWATNTNYYDPVSGTTKTANATYVSTGVEMTSLSAGWYYCNSSSCSISNRIAINGTVNLILCDGSLVTFEKGIKVAEGATLNIYGQSGGTGKLDVYTEDNVCAGIGGDRDETCGTVNIYGGNIETLLKSTSDAAGIGGGYNGGGGTISIYGGNVKATAKDGGSAIGGGYNNNSGIVNIYGGTINAQGGRYGTAGIGGQTINISGGTVTAYGGTSNGESIGRLGGAAIGGICDNSGGSITISGGIVKATGGANAAAIGGGKHGESGTIIISGGQVTATGGDYGAGIGGGYEGASNSITISGGVVNATGGSGSVAIGGGYNGNGGTITISAGQVTAKGGGYAGGFGYYGNSSSLSATINLGWTNATDFIDNVSHSYGGTVTLTNPFVKYNALTTVVTKGNWYDQKIVPAFGVSTVTPAKGTLAVSASLAGAGATITVTPTPSNGYIVGTMKYNDGSDHTIAPSGGVYSFTMPAHDVNVSSSFAPNPTDFSQNGNEYTIHTADGWNVFCDLLNDNTKGFFSNKTVKLGTDISVTSMAGSSHHDFTGTFDGQGNTLTINYDVTEQFAAPFRYMEGGRIENLHVAGTINTSAKYAAGIIGSQYGNVTINNCRSSVTINSTVNGDGTHGGLVAVNCDASSSNLTIEGCVFDGKLLGSTTTDCGGFVGWRCRTLSIINSLYAPIADANTITSGATFARNWNMPDNTNCYYTNPLGSTQAASAYVVTSAPANLGTEITGVSYTILKPYTNGILFDGKYYVAPETMTLADNDVNDVESVNDYVVDVTLSGRTLYKDANWNTLCLPFDVTIADSPLAGDNVVAKVLNAAQSSLDSDGKLTLKFSAAPATIPAGTPFIVKWNNTGIDLVNPVFNGVIVNNAVTSVEFGDGNASFVGTYSPFAITDENIRSILLLTSAGKLGYSKVNRTLGSCRAYILTTGTQAAREFVVDFGDGETTNIQQVESGKLKVEGYYDLQGRKVAQPTKGLYIVNGKKVVVK
jgi:hypothetical protein